MRFVIVVLLLCALTPLWAAGTLKHWQSPVLPNLKPGVTTIRGEDIWTIRTSGTNFAKSLWPAKFYTAACNNNRIMVGWQEGTTFAEKSWTDSVGHISVFQSAGNGNYQFLTDQRFPQCRKIQGIQFTKDCSTVYFLCRASKNTRINFVRDVSREDPIPPEFHEDYMYLFKLPATNLAAAPTAYLLSRKIRGWNTGNHLIKLINNDKSLIYTLKLGMCRYLPNTNPPKPDCHEGSTFQMLDLTTFTTIGDKWGCAYGHTSEQYIAYNPRTNTPMEVCSTDGVPPGYTHAYGMYSHPVGAPGTLLGVFDFSTQITPCGGPGGAITWKDGFLVPFAASRNLMQTDKAQFANDVGIVTFDSSGKNPKTYWVNVDSGYYKNYAKVSPLPNGNLLFGWARTGTKSNNQGDRLYALPNGWCIAEISEFGRVLTTPQCTSFGWGGPDPWDNLVGNPFWVYTWGSQGSSAPYVDQSTGGVNIHIMTYVPNAGNSRATADGTTNSASSTTSATGTTSSDGTSTSPLALAAIIISGVTLLVVVVFVIVFVVMIKSSSPTGEHY